MRYNWIDYAKGMGILLMVFGHTGMPVVLSKFIWSFHMPLFFFISGLLYDREKYSSPGLILKRIWRSLLVPYMFFSVIVAVGYMCINIISHESVFHEFSVVSVLSKGWGGIALWFVSTLIITELLFWLLNAAGKRMILVGGGILLIMSYYAFMQGIHLPYEADNLGMSLLFFSSGHLCKKQVSDHQPEVTESVSLIAITFVASMFFEKLDICSNGFGSGLPNIVIAFFGIMGILFLSKNLESLATKTKSGRGGICSLPLGLLKYIGQNTIILVGLSQIYMMILIAMFRHCDMPGYLSTIIRQSIMWMLLFLSILIFNAYVPRVIGKKERISVTSQLKSLLQI